MAYRSRDRYDAYGSYDSRPSRSRRRSRGYRGSTDVPFVTLVVVIACVVTYLVQHGILQVPLPEWVMPASGNIVRGGSWHCLVTYALLHSGPLHIVNNMLLTWSVGSIVERARGHVVTGASLLLGIVAGGLAHVALCAPDLAVVGESGGAFALLGTYLACVGTDISRTGDRDGSLSRAFTSTAWLVAWNIMCNLIPGSGVSVAAHVGGFVVGLLVGLASAGLGGGGQRRRRV